MLNATASVLLLIIINVAVLFTKCEDFKETERTRRHFKEISATTLDPPDLSDHVTLSTKNSTFSKARGRGKNYRKKRTTRYDDSKESTETTTDETWLTFTSNSTNSGDHVAHSTEKARSELQQNTKHLNHIYLNSYNGITESSLDKTTEMTDFSETWHTQQQGSNYFYPNETTEVWYNYPKEHSETKTEEASSIDFSRAWSDQQQLITKFDRTDSNFSNETTESWYGEDTETTLLTESSTFSVAWNTQKNLEHPYTNSSNQTTETWYNLFQENTTTTTEETWLTWDPTNSSDQLVNSIFSRADINQSIDAQDYDYSNSSIENTATGYLQDKTNTTFTTERTKSSDLQDYKSLHDEPTTPIPTNNAIIWSNCFEYLNTSDQNYAYINETPTGLMLIMLNEDETPCLQIKLDIMIQVYLLRSNSSNNVWSAAFFSHLPDNNAKITGDCGNGNDQHVQILWDKYAMTWRFAKDLYQNFWYLRSLEFLTLKSDWFARYGFVDTQCWRFQYFSDSMLRTPMHESYKSCKRNFLKLTSEEDSLNTYVFLLKDQFQAQAFMKNQTIFDFNTC